MNNARGLLIALFASLLLHAVLVYWGQKLHAQQSGHVPIFPRAGLLTVALLEPNPENDSASNHPANATKDVPDNSPVAFAQNGRLTKLPELLGELPEIALDQTGKNGQTISVRLIVSANGKVVFLNVLASSLPRLVEEQVVAALYHANYRPGEVDGKPVNAEMLLSVTVD